MRKLVARILQLPGKNSEALEVTKIVHKAHGDYINNIIGASLKDNRKAV